MFLQFQFSQVRNQLGSHTIYIQRVWTLLSHLQSSPWKMYIWPSLYKPGTGDFSPSDHQVTSSAQRLGSVECVNVGHPEPRILNFPTRNGVWLTSNVINFNYLKISTTVQWILLCSKPSSAATHHVCLSDLHILKPPTLLCCDSPTTSGAGH